MTHTMTVAELTVRAGLACLVLGLGPSAAASAGNLEIGFDVNDFSDSTLLDNDFWGLRLSGPTSSVFFSESADGCEVGESMVTGATGSGFFDSPYDVDAVVIRDREWVSEECDGEYVLVEDTFDWYARDDDGNVWYLGEDTTAWDDELDCLTGAGSWKAGEDGAEPGVIMPGEPRPGVAYQQEYYEGEAEDRAKVLRLNSEVSVDFGDYEGCLATKEYTPLAPGEIEHKFYCRLSHGGVGLTLISELKGSTKRVEYVGTVKPDGTYPAAFPTDELCAAD